MYKMTSTHRPLRSDATPFSEHPRARNWSDNNELKPHQVAMKTHKKFWFDCDKCPHAFDSTLANITNGGNWCPYCSNNKVCGDTKCEFCFKKSFASHPKAKYWSDKNNKNPYMVALNCHTKYLFDCPTCPHSFPAAPHTVNGSNCWCPYCANRSVCGEKGCEFCLKKSFASHPKAKYWSNKNKLKPYQVSRCSNKKFLFDCPTCPHLFPCKLGNISCNGRWCPYCAIPNKKLCGNSECKFCFNKSIASHEKANCWSDENKLKQYEVALNSNKKFLWSCDNCGKPFLKRCADVNRGGWCPYCTNTTEIKLLKWLLKQYWIKKVKHQYKPKWCSTEYCCIIKGDYKTKRYQYSYDFFVTFQNGKQLIIELDGRQHFEQVSNWKTPLHNQIRDKYKEIKARQHKLKVIRILQEDVWYDRNDWKAILTKKLILK